MLPRSAADILASARPAPQIPAPKKPRRAAKVKPSTSDKRFIQFSATATASTSTSGSAPVPFPNLSTETGSSGPYITPSTFKFLPASTPETYLKTRRDGHIADGGHCEEFDFISTPLEMFESDSSDQGCLDAEPPKALKSPVQRFEDVLAILREGGLSPFDLILHLLDDTNLKHWEYRNELYKEESKKLSEILERISSNALGKEKLKESILPHALEIVSNKVMDEMNLVQEEKPPGLDTINPEFIKTWRVSGHQEKAPFLFNILLAAAESGAGIREGKE